MVNANHVEYNQRSRNFDLRLSQKALEGKGYRTQVLEDEKNLDRARENFKVSKISELGCLPALVSAGHPERLKARSVLKAAGLLGF